MHLLSKNEVMGEVLPPNEGGSRGPPPENFIKMPSFSGHFGIQSSVNILSVFPVVPSCWQVN